MFYDLMQYHLGSCQVENIAVMMFCPVVARHIERNELVIYGGAVHFSKDRIIINDETWFGQLADYQNYSCTDLISDAYIRSLSQEHGIVKVNKDVFSTIKTGDLIGVIPVHSCLTVSSMGAFYNTSGKKLL